MTRGTTESAPRAPRKSRSKRAGTAAPDASRYVDEIAPDDARLREFIADFSAASASMRTLRRCLAEAVGLTSAEHSVVLGIWYCERKGDTSVRQLADHLHVAAAHVTAEIGKLEEAGLVEKTPDPADKRAVVVRLTDEGHRLLDRLAPILRDVNMSVLAGLSYEDMAIAHRFLSRMIVQAPEAIQVIQLWTTQNRLGEV